MTVVTYSLLTSYKKSLEENYFQKTIYIAISYLTFSDAVILEALKDI